MTRRKPTDWQTTALTFDCPFCQAVAGTWCGLLYPYQGGVWGFTNVLHSMRMALSKEQMMKDGSW